jgi:hypothetical protein
MNCTGYQRFIALQIPVLIIEPKRDFSNKDIHAQTETMYLKDKRLLVENV